MTMMSSSTCIIALIITCPLTQAFTSIQHLPHVRSNTNLNVEPAAIAGAVAITGGAIAFWASGANDREKQAKSAEWEAKEREYQEQRERLAYIEPKELWTVEELKANDGSDADETGPVLLAVKGDVFNVWKGRNFYGPSAEYHIMAGRDATRFLAKNKLEEESAEELRVELNIAERANLETWYWIIRNKYDLVGRLDGYDPKSAEM